MFVHPIPSTPGARALEYDPPTALSRLSGHDGPNPFVLGQLGQSLDGRIATPTGSSRGINGPAAMTHLHQLRALVDAVVVGAAAGNIERRDLWIVSDEDLRAASR